MAKITIELTLDVGQEKKLKEKATAALKSEGDILLGLANEHVLAQINQWIKDDVTTKLAELSPADALARLSYFDSK